MQSLIPHIYFMHRRCSCAACLAFADIPALNVTADVARPRAR